MKKTMPLLTSALLVMTTAAVPVLRTGIALADDHKWHSQHSVTFAASATGQGSVTGSAAGANGNVTVSTNATPGAQTGDDTDEAGLNSAHDLGILLGDGGDHGKGKKDKDKDDEHNESAKRGNKGSQVNAQQLAQLKAALQQLHTDQKAERAAHKQLTADVRQFIYLMQTAIVEGNTTAVNDGTQGIQQVVVQLQAALKAQQGEDQNSKDVDHIKVKGDLSAALQAVAAADAKVKAKTQAMLTADKLLKALIATMQSDLAGSSGSTDNSTGNTTDNGTSNSAGNNTTGGNTVDGGNVVITPSGSNS